MDRLALLNSIKVYRCVNPNCLVILYKVLEAPAFVNCSNCLQLGIPAEDDHQKEARR